MPDDVGDQRQLVWPERETIILGHDMDPKAMEPYGAALSAYFEGDANAEVIVRRDDGEESKLPISYFFRQPSAFTPIENAAIDYCTGHVLDVGAGTGVHTLALQEMCTRTCSTPQCVRWSSATQLGGAWHLARGDPPHIAALLLGGTHPEGRMLTNLENDSESLFASASVFMDIAASRR